MDNEFTLTIRCDNDAFTPDPCIELARLLRKVADKVERVGVDDGTGSITGSISDINGNRVGEWEYTGGDE